MSQTKMDILIEEVREIKATQKDHGEKLYDMHGKVSKLEVKSSIFGMLGGLVVAFLAWAKGQIG
jgi:hypothetical protein